MMKQLPSTRNGEAVTLRSEVVHGILRGIFLVPHVGEFRSSQIGVFTGSLVILAIALAFVPWLGATRSSQLLGIGVLWLGLTLAFEFLFGRIVVGASWERLAADYNVLKGGLLPFGMVVLALSPWIAGKVRGMIPCGAKTYRKHHRPIAPPSVTDQRP